MTFSYKRSERIASLLQKELAQILSLLKDPGLSGLLTLTGVEMSADLKQAKAYYSILGEEAARKSSQEAVERSLPFIRRELGTRLTMRHTPILTFIYDATPERAGRIFDLLAQIEKEKKDAPVKTQRKPR